MVEPTAEANRQAVDAAASELVLNKLRQGLCVFDSTHRLAQFNKRYAEIYDLRLDDLRVGLTLREVVDLRFAAGTGPDMTRDEYAVWRDKIAVENRVSETVVHLRNGRIVEIHHEPTPDGGWVATHDDITERVRAEARIAESEARLRALTDALPQMVWLSRGEARETTYKNAQFDAYYGPIGPGLVDRVATNHPDDADRMRTAREHCHEAGTTYAVEGRLRRHDGVYRWHKLVMIPVLRDGAIAEWLGTALDIDDIVTAREELRVSEERLALALEAGSDGLWDCDLITNEAWFSERWWATLGFEPGALKADAQTWRHLLHPEDAPRVLRLLAEHLAQRSPIFECEHRLRRRDGSWAWVLTRGKVVARGPDDAPRRIVGTQIDIGARKVAESQIAHMARHDALTDLPNRTLFRERLDQKLAEARRYGGTCAVLCLDLDRFKSVNDTLGHLAGDALLREVAHRLRSLLRAEDTVARLGGDEFAVLLGGATEPARIAMLAERLIATVQEPVACGDHQVEVGLSIGIALAPNHGEDSETVFKRADLALYRSKAEGRNTYRFFEPAMDEAAAERRGLELDLRRALALGEMRLHYQPQVRGATRELVGFEALARWEHPSRGLVPPAAFIPLAEETGLIVPLGEWVLRTACAEAVRWSRPLKVAVNISARQFQQADLPETILGILTETGLSPARLELEITESVIIHDMSRALGILRRLRGLGIRIAMDDFGTGHSSLATLQAFPFDKIKIDRSFVGKVEESPQAAVIVRAVLGLGRSLGMGVIAEGVETPEQMRFLTDEACDEAQGYLFGRPAPIEHFADVIYGSATELAPDGPADEDEPLARVAAA